MNPEEIDFDHLEDDKHFKIDDVFRKEYKDTVDSIFDEVENNYDNINTGGLTYENGNLVGELFW